MPSDIRTTLDLGNYYAANKQWQNAATRFEKALIDLYASVPSGVQLSSVSGLEEAVKRSGDHAVSKDSASKDKARFAMKQLLEKQLLEKQALEKALEGLRGDAVSKDSVFKEKAPFALKKLWMEQAKAHPGLGLENAKFMSAFRAGTVRHWTVVYHGQRKIRAGDDVEITLPHGSPVAFVLDLDKEAPRSALLSAARSAQIAYALSHLAWANVTIAIHLYTEGHVLIRDGVQLIMKEAYPYRQALLLRPDSPWTLAHYGETYRNIANAWPPSVEEMTTPVERVKDYVRAMLYFEEAIKQDSEDFWAHAHLGAAIVNVRGFVGSAKGVAPLQRLLEKWFPDGVDAHQRDMELLHKAWKSLQKAQHLRGNFYPWAQLYAADLLVIRSVVLTDSAKAAEAAEAARLGMVMTLDAMYLDPALARDLFEPAELYDNAFYQLGLLALWIKDYPLAWRYVCFGLSRAFKFQFIPGLQYLLGHQLLANIAAASIRSSKHKERAGDKGAIALLDRYALDAPSQAPFQLHQLIGSRNKLIKFLRVVFDSICLPAVNPFLLTDIALGTKISVSLTQVCLILRNFQHLLNEPDHSSVAHSKLWRDMDKCIHDILERLSASLPKSESQKPQKLRLKPKPLWGDPEGDVGNLFVQINSNTLSYDMFSTLELTDEEPTRERPPLPLRVKPEAPVRRERRARRRSTRG